MRQSVLRSVTMTHGWLIAISASPVLSKLCANCPQDITLSVHPNVGCASSSFYSHPTKSRQSPQRLRVSNWRCTTPWSLAGNTRTNKQAMREEMNQTTFYMDRDICYLLLYQVLRIVCSSNAHNRVQNTPQFLPILRQKNPVHALQPHLFQINFNIILISTPATAQQSLSYWSSQSKMYAFLCSAMQATFPTQILFHHLINPVTPGEK